MKKFCILMLTVLVMMAACLSGCGSSSSSSSSAASASTTAQASSTASTTAASKSTTAAASSSTTSAATTTASGSRTLVVYFSRTGEQYTVGVIEKGNTAIAAEMIAEKTGADMYEILPADDYYPYTYNELTEVAKKEQSENARPAIKGELPDLSGYDTIFICSPVWWTDWPMLMYTFFESADLSGKTLVPMVTHAGSGLSGMDTKLAKACPSAKVLEGLAIVGADCQNDQDAVSNSIDTWLNKLGLAK